MSARRSLLLALAAVVAVAVNLSPPAHVQAATSVTLDGTSAGSRFDGLGAISGGGGTSRLLFDYPSQQRSDILDYLFKPNYGASLQILKVEIGGDTNSTNGAEASHMRSRTDLDCTRGYEWWLMKEARARNPNIVLAGLAWGAPGWLGGGNFFSQDTIDYLIKWLGCAQANGLTIDYLGGQNESGYSKSWLESLKSQLQRSSFPGTKVIAGDEIGDVWNVVNDMATDPTFGSAMDVAGVHYPCRNVGSPARDCTPGSPNRGRLARPLWASEHGSQNFNTGAPALARAMNRDYVDSRMTAMINWSLASAWYPTLPDWGDGLMAANEPWSGWYIVGASVWVMAHTTQFAQPGWQYLDASSGYLGGVRANGGFVTLRSPNGSDYSTVIETTDATAPQTVTFDVTGGLSTGTVHVWSTNLASQRSTDWFVQQPDVAPGGGSYTVTLQPHSVYTLTTTTGQAKGTAVSPPSAGLALPYADDFESYPAGALAKYVSAVQGAFETAPCAGGHTGMCLRQVIDQAPIPWPIGSDSPPIAVTGDPNWTDVRVSVDAMLEQPGNVDLIGRSQGVAQFGPGGSAGYHLRATDGGAWTLFKEDSSGSDTTLASGSAPFGVSSWHNLALSLQADAIQASIDGATVASVTDSQFATGQVGLLSGKWQKAQFDNLAVTALGGGGGPVSVDDSVQGTGPNAFDYQGGGWGHCTGGCGGGDPTLFNGSNSWDNVTDESVTLSFTGTQVGFYGVLDPGHGIGAVSVDGGPETMVDFFSATRAGNKLLWTSPVLPAGAHTFRLRVTGTKNPASSGFFATVDRVVIFNGTAPPPPTPTPTPTPASAATVDDSVMGSGLNQFNYRGGWQHCSNCGADLFNGTNSWDNTTGDSVTVAFNGNGIRFYGVVDPQHGIGAVSIDGGPETMVDFYSANRTGNRLLWTSPVLASGRHTFELRVTGTKNGASSNFFVVPDRVDITRRSLLTPPPAR